MTRARVAPAHGDDRLSALLARRPRAVAALIFVVALAARLLYLWKMGARTMPDSAEYLQLAHNLLGHHVYSLDVAAPFSPSAARVPGYPFLIAVIMWCGASSLTAIAIVQATMGALVAPIVFWLARTAVPTAYALAAALLYAFHPAAISLTTVILSEAPFFLLVAAALLCLVVAVTRNAKRWTVAAAALMAAAVLCRPIALAFPFCLAAILVIQQRTRAAARHAAIFAGATMVVLAPWSARCSVYAHRLVITQLDGAGQNVYMPTRSDWRQGSHADNMKMFDSLLTSDDPCGLALRQAQGIEQRYQANRECLKLAWRNIAARPGAYVAARAHALPHLFLTRFDWFVGPNLGPAARTAKLAQAIVFSLLPLLLACLGLLDARSSVTLALCATTWLTTIALHIPLYVESRYWVPVVPALLVNAVAGLRRVVAGAQRVRSRTAEPELS